MEFLHTRSTPTPGPHGVKVATCAVAMEGCFHHKVRIAERGIHAIDSIWTGIEIFINPHSCISNPHFRGAFGTRIEHAVRSSTAWSHHRWSERRRNL